MKEYKKLQEMDRRARELAGLYAAERERADALESELRALRKNRTCKDSLQVGNGAKMREALKYLRDASRGFCHLILNSKHNEIYDKYKHPEVAKISDAIANANITLSAPPRNCDLYLAKKERDAAYQKYREHVILSSANPYVAQDEMMSKEEWLLAEAKGGVK
jgi:hypothetical protein